MKSLILAFSSAFSNLAVKIKENKTAFYFCAIAAFFYVLPLLLANVYYTDDMLRSTTGIGWGHDGRQLASTIMYALTTGERYISDYFPYSIIFAAIIMALSGYIISVVLEIEKGKKYRLSALVLLINPFFLENLSYRWDSLPMAISIFAVIFPFLFISDKRVFIPVSIIGIIISMLTYQPSVVIYPLMVVALLLKYCIDDVDYKKCFKFLFICIIAFLIALILHKVLDIILNLYRGHRNLYIFSNKDFWEILSFNADQTWLLIKSAFNKTFTILIAVSLLICLISYIKYIVQKNALYNKILTILLPLFIIILIPSTLLLLEGHGFVSRILVGFSFLIYTMLLFINRLSSKFVTIIALLFFINSLSLMAAYANGLKAQNNFDNFIAQKIAHTVKIDKRTFLFDGRLQYAKEIDGTLKSYPILKRLIPIYLNHNWDWGKYTFNRANHHIYPTEFVDIGQNKSFERVRIEYDSICQQKMTYPIVDETPYYIIRADSATIIVDFKKEKN